MAYYFPFIKFVISRGQTLRLLPCLTSLEINTLQFPLTLHWYETGQYHEKATLWCYLFVVGGGYFDTNIILYEQALSLGDNGCLILKTLCFQPIILQRPHYCKKHINARNISPHHFFLYLYITVWIYASTWSLSLSAWDPYWTVWKNPPVAS